MQEPARAAPGRAEASGGLPPGRPRRQRPPGSLPGAPMGLFPARGGEGAAGAGGPGMVRLPLRPVPDRPGRSIACTGEVELGRSRQPLFDAARALLARGSAPATPLAASHAGSATVVRRATLGEAAGGIIEESDRDGLRKRRWLPRRPAAEAVEARLQIGPGSTAPPGSGRALLRDRRRCDDAA